jgi:UDP-N-acetylmuramate--alanine ligase
LKRSEILGLITDSSYNICVAGTHGKTTTSTMVAHLLKDTGFGCNAFLGGIASNYNTNFWSSEKNLCVVEADEFDRSFLKLSPDIAVITAADPDHLDIYGNAETFREAFEQFSLRVKPGGCLLVRHGLGLHAGSNTNTLTYSVEDQDADYHILSHQILNGAFHFDLMADGNQLTGFELRMGGLHNLENAVAAIAVSLRIGIEVEKIRLALRSFSGVKRRFEYIWQNEKMGLIDDYAHHPKELTALIDGARRMFEGKKITLVFQPHLYSRTRDFADEFARALGLADEIYLLPIYPARELPIEGIESQWIASKMLSESVSCLSKDALLDKIRHQVQSNEIEVLITAGAGDIDTLVIPIKNIFENN